MCWVYFSMFSSWDKFPFCMYSLWSVSSLYGPHPSIFFTPLLSDSLWFLISYIYVLVPSVHVLQSDNQLGSWPSSSYLHSSLATLPTSFDSVPRWNLRKTYPHLHNLPGQPFLIPLSTHLNTEVVFPFSSRVTGTSVLAGGMSVVWCGTVYHQGPEVDLVLTIWVMAHCTQEFQVLLDSL